MAHSRDRTIRRPRYHVCITKCRSLASVGCECISVIELKEYPKQASFQDEIYPSCGYSNPFRRSKCVETLCEYRSRNKRFMQSTREQSPTSFLYRHAARGSLQTPHTFPQIPPPANKEPQTYHSTRHPRRERRKRVRHQRKVRITNPAPP